MSGQQVVKISVPWMCRCAIHSQNTWWQLANGFAICSSAAICNALRRHYFSWRRVIPAFIFGSRWTICARRDWNFQVSPTLTYSSS
jgi:endonuclease I